MFNTRSRAMDDRVHRRTGFGYTARMSPPPDAGDATPNPDPPARAKKITPATGGAAPGPARGAAPEVSDGALAAKAVAGDDKAFAALLKSQKPMKEASGLDPLGHLARSAWNKLDRRARGSGQAPRPMTLASEELARLGDRERDNWVTPKLHADALTNAQWDMLVRTTVPGLLHYEDADSMAFSIEARVPFLDYRLVELAFDLPAEVKIDGAVTKQVLRRAMDGILPEPVRQRSDKKGFPTPFSRWIRTEPHRGFIEELLRGSRAKARGLTTGAKVEALLGEHLRGEADHGAKLWQLATLELFCRRFLDQPFKAEPPRDVRAAPR